MSFSGSIGETFVSIRPDTSGFERDATRKLDAAAGRLGQGFSARLGDAAGRVGQLGKSLSGLSAEKLEQVGGVLTRRVTLPLALAGGAAVKMGSDFETAFSRIAGLTDVPAGEIDGLKKSVLALAGETTRSPQELANALYATASAGLNAKQSIAVLGASAKAAAAGLGDTATVTDLVTGVVNAYGASNITASKTVDTLVAAVRTGKAEPEAFAATLGRVLPLASQLGVSFDQVAGAVAVLSNGSIDAETATTGLRQALANILNPSAQATKQLAALGISTGELRETVKTKGLVPALLQLKTQIGGNDEAMANIIPDVRALTSVLSLLGQEPAKVAAVLDATKNSTGALDTAFQAFSNTASAKLKGAAVESQVALLKLSDTLLPIAGDVLPRLTHGLEVGATAFAGMPGPARTALVAIGAIGALSGPIFTVVGNLKRLGGVVSDLGAKASGAKRVGDALGSGGIGTGAGEATTKVSRLRTVVGGLGVTAGMIGIGLLFDKIGNDAAKARDKAESFVARLQASVGSDPQKQLARLTEEFKRQVDLFNQAKAGKGGLDFKDAKVASDNIDRLQTHILDLRALLTGQKADAKAAADALGQHGAAADDDANSQQNLGTALLENSLKAQGATLDTADAVDKLNQAMRDDDPARIRADLLRDVADASDAFTDAQQRQIDAQKRLNDLRAKDPAEEERKASLDARDATLGLRDAKLGVLEAEQKLAEIRDHNKEVADAEKALADAQNRSAKGTVNKTQAVIDAEAKLADARGKRATDVERAELDLERARLQVETQTDAQAEAEQHLADVRSGKLHAQELADAEHDVERASRDTARAADALRDAEDRQRRVTEELERKKRDVERALYDVITAEKAEVDALALLNPALDTPTAKTQALRDRLQSLHDKLKDPDARKALEEFIAKLNPGVAAGADAAAGKINNLGVEVDKLSPRAKALSEYLAIIAGLAPAPTGPAGALPKGPIGGGSSGLGGLFPGRAAGGSVERGHLYAVLEGGRDETLLLPNVSGRVVPGAPGGDVTHIDRSIKVEHVNQITQYPSRDLARELEDIAWMNQGW